MEGLRDIEEKERGGGGGWKNLEILRRRRGEVVVGLEI